MEKNTENDVSIMFESNVDLDKTLSYEEYTERLQQLLQSILDKTFPGNKGKQEIRVYNDRISFACPYCMDSMQSNYKKRGNFILNKKYAGFYKCHNCGIFKRIDHFFKDFKIELKLDAINFIAENQGDFNTYRTAKYDMSLLLDMDSIEEYAIDREILKEKLNLVEVKNSSIWNWLANRLQFQENKFLFNSNENYLLILNLTQKGKIIGAQKRIFKKYNNFLTFRLSKLHEAIGTPLIVDEEQIQYLDTLSMIFNVCLIDFNKSITLFEGPMDAFLFKNSIASSGAHKEFPLDIPIRYFYDDDKTGIAKSIEHIGERDEVFLWDSFKRAIDLPYREKWDLNDVLVYLKKENKTIPLLDNYFSDDPLDIINV